VDGDVPAQIVVLSELLLFIANRYVARHLDQARCIVGDGIFSRRVLTDSPARNTLYVQRQKDLVWVKEGGVANDGVEVETSLRPPAAEEDGTLSSLPVLLRRGRNLHFQHLRDVPMLLFFLLVNSTYNESTLNVGVQHSHHLT